MHSPPSTDAAWARVAVADLIRRSLMALSAQMAALARQHGVK